MVKPMRWASLLFATLSCGSLYLGVSLSYTPSVQVLPSATLSAIEAVPITERTPEPTPTQEALRRVQVVGNYRVNVRETPNTSAKVLWVAVGGEPIDLLELQGDWGRVIDWQGRTGWLQIRFIEDVP